MVGKNRNPPWSDLPQELLSTIANFLTSNPISIFTFRSICHSWRSACPPLSNSPLLSPLLPLIIPSTPYRNFNNSIGYSKLSVTIIYALYRPLQLPQPEHGSSSSLLSDAWILFVDEFTTGKPSIRKPFSNSSYFTPINFPNVNLIDSNVRELGRFYNFSCSSNYDEYRECKLSKPRFCVAEANKVVMFPNEIVADANEVVMFPNEIVAIALHEDGTLGMYRVEVGSNEWIIEWETIHDGKGFRFDDIVEYKGRVLGVDRRGRVYEIKHHSSELTPFVATTSGGGGRRKRLVESLGRLYLVVSCYVNPGRSKKFARLKGCGPNGVKEEIKKIKFKVYELNEEKKKWIEISSLGDRSFSFGRNFSFSASSKELGTCVKNCILFTRHSFLSYSWNADDFTGFKKCELGLDISVCHLHEADHFGDIESYPGYSDSLWPPPNWLWSIDRSLPICSGFVGVGVGGDGFGVVVCDLIYFTGKDYVFRFDVPGIRQANLRCTATGSKFSFTAQEPKTHRFGIGICEPRYYEGRIELDPLVYQPERFTAKVNNGVLLIQIPKILDSAGMGWICLYIGQLKAYVDADGKTTVSPNPYY